MVRVKPENTSKSSIAANSDPGKKNTGDLSSNSKNISQDLFSSRLIQQSPLSEEVFTNKKSTSASTTGNTSTEQHSTWHRTRWMRMVFYTGVAVVAILLLLGGWTFFNSRQGGKSTGQFAVTSADLAGLNTNKVAAASGLVIVNGNTQIAGSVTANTFSGSGADLTNLNADNITQGTLNDARLSANVALLDGNQTFTGSNVFSGQVTLPNTVGIGAQTYNFPAIQAAGSLVNDGSGNLVWNPAGGCVTCFTNGGNSFGGDAVLGTNDPFNLEFRTAGATRLTINSAGSSAFGGAVSATSFSGDGLALTNLDATQLTTGTLSNARLSASVTTQGNVFNGINQLVQIDALGHLPVLNATNLTNLNASSLSSGTVADGRLSANVALLNAGNIFSNGNTFSAGITTNTIDTGTGLTVGNTARSLTLQGNATTNITATTGLNATTVGFSGIPTGSVTYNFDRSAAPGTYTICTTAGGACGGGGGGTVSSPGGTANKLAKFTAAQTIADSSITDTGTAVTIQPSGNSTSTFQVVNAGGGSSIFDVDTTNGRVGINSATPSYALDVVGDINSSTGLRVGGTLISSTNLTNDANLAKLNGNQTFSGNNIFSNPITVNTLTPTGAMTIGSVGQDLTLQGNGNTVLTSTNAGGLVTVGFNGVSTGNVSYQFDAAAAPGTYTICTTAGGACGGGGGGTVSSPGGTANKLAKFTAAQTIADSTIDDTGTYVSISAPELRVNGAVGGYAIDAVGDINAGQYLRVGGNIVCDSSGCIPGSLPPNVTLQGNTFNGISELVQTNGLGYLPALNGGNLTSLNASNVTSGTLSDARLTNNVALLDANQTFTGTNAFTQTVTVNTLTPTGAMTIGATNQNLTLRGNASASLNSTNAGGTVSVGFSGVSSGSVAYQFDATATPGTYTICTTAGGACGGTISSLGGTTNKIAKFSGAQTIADSSITDTGSAITVQPSGNSTTTFQVVNAGGGSSIFDVDTTNGRVGVNNAAPSYPLDVTGDINSTTGLRVGGVLVCTNTGCITGGGGGSFIQNQTTQQSAANFFIQSVAAGNISGVIKAIAAQTADLLQFQNSSGTPIANITAGGSFNTTGQYQVNGVQISSADLSNNSNLAKLNATQLFTGNNSFSGTISQQNAANSTSAFAVLNDTANSIFNVDTTNGRVGVNDATPSYPLDVTGDINSSTGLRVGGTLVCDITGCAASGSSGFYIQNGVAQQTSANFNIQSTNVNNVVGILQGKSGQVADLFNVNDGTGAIVFKVNNAGLTTINNGISLTGGNQSITNNTGGLNLVSNGTTIGLNNTATITSGDGTGLRYAGSYTFQPLSLVSRAYVDAAISGVVAGACPTCFLNGGNSFGIAASAGTNDNNTFALETVNTQRILLGTNGGIALQGSTASGNYSTATGNATASGDYSFATGFNNGSGLTSSGIGSFAGGYSLSFGITASGTGSLAFGMTRSGVITTNNAEGSFAGGDNSAVGTGANNSISYGLGTRANGLYSAAFNNATASGPGSFAIGTSTASGQNSFAGGYNLGFGITSSGLGSIAFGVGRDGVITASGEGSFAGGNNSTATAQNAIAFGTGTHATGVYSAAFNNSIASNSGAFAINNGTASGILSFAGGEAGTQAYGRSSFAYGYNVKANDINGNYSVAFGRDSTANHNYSFAAGYGARTTNGEANVAFNYALSSGSGSFAIGSTLVESSGTHSFAGGYAGGAITSSSNGSFAFGFSGGNPISATGGGAFAIGMSRDGAILASGLGSLAGGTNSTASNEFAIAYGTGTQATGAYSAAFNNSVASGTGAFSIGNATASGVFSFAGGEGGARAYAQRSFVFGYNAKANNLSGVGSVAFGLNTTANNNYSTAFGQGATASGDTSFAIGNGIASGAYSFAGYSSTASGTGAIGFGNLNTASGQWSLAFGDSSTAAGVRSVAIGYQTNANTVNGEGSFALGRATTANGDYSFALGYGPTASSTAAFAIGGGSVASGTYSFAGYNSTASADGAFTFGSGNTSSGQYSLTFGTLNTASGFNSTAFGRRMNVSGNYSFGVSLNDTALNVTDPNSFVINAGYVGINTASPSSYSSAFSLVGTGYTYGSTVVSTGIASRVRAGDNSSGTLIQFERADTTVVGSITHNGSNTAYNTSSDERLKHDITDTNLSLDTVLQLKVHDFIYNNDASNTVTTGFIAQELQKLYPEAVSVMDTKTGYLGVDYGKLTPLLAKGIQDLNTKVDSLQSEVDQLKTNQNTTNTTSVDVVAELAKASAITINGNLTVNGKVIVVGSLELKGDNTGNVTIPAGQTRIHLSFTKAFTNVPNVTASPKTLTKASFAVENESINGFDIVIDQAQTTDTNFNYHAL